MCSCCPSLSPSLLTGLWDVEYVSVVLFCYILDDVCVMCEKKNVDNKTNRAKYLQNINIVKKKIKVTFVILIYFAII